MLLKSVFSDMEWFCISVLHMVLLSLISLLNVYGINVFIHSDLVSVTFGSTGALYSNNNA